MNEQERITYVELAIQVELERLGTVYFFTPEIWEEKFLSRADVDPLNVHKPYGFVTPQLIEGHWFMGVSASHLIRPVADRDDRDLNDWVTYWLLHMGLHFVVSDWAVNLGDTDLTMEELERRVDAAFEEQGRDLFAFGHQVKLLTKQKATGQ